MTQNICRFTKAAERDLHDIFIFIARDNIDRADSYFHELLACCHRLADFPRMGIISPSHQNGRRSFSYDNYLIYYRPLANNKGVLITRIINAKKRRL